MRRTVLLVDDVQMFLEIQKEYLQESNVKILTAKDGAEALEVIKNRQPDLVFMDLQMPRMDGASCCKAVKSDSMNSKIPVVLISSTHTKDDVDRCYLNGCDFFIAKPYGRDLFLDVARKFLSDIDRRNKRLPCRLKAEVSFKDDFVSCAIHNISIGGAFISTDYRIDPGNVIKIAFSLPDGHEIECQGRITWVNGNNPKFPPDLE